MMRWAWRICRSLGAWIAFFLILDAVLFAVFDLLPDAAARHLGWAAVNPELLDQTRQRMGLSASPGQRYHDHLRALLHGELGRSSLTGVPVTQLLSTGLSQSAGLWCVGAVSILIAPILAVFITVRRSRSVLQSPARIIGWFGLAPQLLIAAVAFAAYTTIGASLSAPEARAVRFVFASFSTAAYPAALSYLIASDIAAGLRDSYMVRTYLAMGLSWPRIRLLLLKNVAIGFAPYSARLAIGMLFSSGLTEFVFSINGFGLLFFRALRNSDLGVLFGCVFLIATVVALLSIVERKVREP